MKKRGKLKRFKRKIGIWRLIGFSGLLLELVKDPKLKFSVYENLKSKELIDWINDMENYFECKDVEDPQRIKFAKAKLKGSAKIWWQKVQSERNQRGK